MCKIEANKTASKGLHLAQSSAAEYCISTHLSSPSADTGEQEAFDQRA